VRAIIKGAARTIILPKAVRQAILPQTAAAVTGIMEKVVTDGTGKSASLVSYSVAGKTGTADKLVNGRYSPYQQNVSFVGFVPSRAPALTIVVMVDSPRAGGDTGGAIAAPIFKRIADGALRHLGTTPTINPLPPVMVARSHDTPVTPAATRQPAVVAMPANMTDTGVPDLRGMSAREALRELARLGLSARMEGIGFVVDQNPPAGSPLEPGASCTLVLNRVLPRSMGVIGDPR
jgi:membrane peptidoglycan carboxypeptidase